MVAGAALPSGWRGGYGWARWGMRNKAGFQIVCGLKGSFSDVALMCQVRVSFQRKRSSGQDIFMRQKWPMLWKTKSLELTAESEQQKYSVSKPKGEIPAYPLWLVYVTFVLDSRGCMRPFTALCMSKFQFFNLEKSSTSAYDGRVKRLYANFTSTAKEMLKPFASWCFSVPLFPPLNFAPHTLWIRTCFP